MTITNFRTVNSGESLYMLVPKAGYSVLAFADSNGDFNYQPGEPAARIDDPVINWFSDMQGQDRVDYEALEVQQIELTKTTVLDQKLDFSMENLREATGSSENFLRVVSWDEERFSDDNMQRGMWEPVTFQEEVGFGLYLCSWRSPRCTRSAQSNTAAGHHRAQHGRPCQQRHAVSGG